MLGGLLGRKWFLDEDLETWALETWAWLMRNLDGIEHVRSTPLVTPSRAYFPPSEAVGHERAQHVFGCVKTLMGMQDWDCILEPYSRREANARVGEYWFLRTASAPNGTFRIRDGTVRISYAKDLIDKPVDLVATLAHELCHYRLAAIEEPNPGGSETHELDTDLAVAFMGFGVFGANRAFSFEQHGDAFGQGWQSSRNGYLSERTWAFAIALFLALKEDSGASASWLKPHIASDVAKADRYLRRKTGVLATLRSIG